MTEFDTYLSPFTWRYGSPEMRRIWSEEHKRLLWRQIWVTLAQVQSEWGLVSPEQIDDITKHATTLDIPRALQIEAEIHHDLMAELSTFAQQCPIGGGILHLGATSMDIEDNADALRLRQSVDLIRVKLAAILRQFAVKIEQWADLPIMAFTHLQPAEPSTLGYRFSLYAQDLLEDWNNLSFIRRNLSGKGFKGAVGTSAAYADLISVDQLAVFESRLSESLGLPFYPIASQVYPRKQDYTLLCALAGIGASLSKFALDIRILQSPPVGEWAEPFGEKQVGSSAMPFKRNPIQSEKIGSLARVLAQMPRTAWDNASNSILERTLDDSANRRIILPEAFLVTDELLSVATRLITKMQINLNAINNTLNIYAPFAATEHILMALAKAGADRQEMHAVLRQHALTAWQAVQTGMPNPLKDLICQDAMITSYIPAVTLVGLLDITRHTGDAPQRARKFAQTILTAIG